MTEANEQAVFESRHDRATKIAGVAAFKPFVARLGANIAPDEAF